MDFLQIINHLQKRARFGVRVHGIGQGHDATQINAAARADDAPDNAAIGYMNADLLDGYHGRQIYHGEELSLQGGINADTLDGIDRSLGHVDTASDFNNPATDYATVSVTFTGTPQQNDAVTLQLYVPGVQSPLLVTRVIVAAAPTLADIVNELIAEIGLVGNAPFASHLSAYVLDGTDTLELTVKDPGPYGNLYTLKVSTTPAGVSTLATNTLSGVYRFAGGGPEEGIHADKLDGFHGREHYHQTDSVSAQVVKAPPAGRGLNADTLDSFHGREAYHGIQPPSGTGLNADTLDGVHKLFGHKTGADQAGNYSKIAVVVGKNGDLSLSGTTGDTLTITLYDVLGAQLATHTFSPATIVDEDDMGSDVLTTLSGSPLGAYLSASYVTGTNVLTLSSLVVGERANYTVDLVSSNSTLKLKLAGADDTTYSTSIRGYMVPATDNNAKLGVDADMLDGVHAGSGHFGGYPRQIDGQVISGGINADAVDGLHARTGRPTAAVQTGTNVDGSLDLGTAYLPVADGTTVGHLSRSTYNVPVHIEFAQDSAVPTAGTYDLKAELGTNPNTYKFTWNTTVLDNVAWEPGTFVTITDAVARKLRLHMIGTAPTGLVLDSIGVTVGSLSRNPNLDADTLDGLHGEDYTVSSTHASADMVRSRVRLSDALRRGNDHFIATGADIRAMDIRGDFAADPLRWSTDNSLVDTGVLNSTNGNGLYIVRTTDNTLHDSIGVNYDTLRNKPSVPAASTVFTGNGSGGNSADYVVNGSNQKLNAGVADYTQVWKTSSNPNLMHSGGVITSGIVQARDLKCLVVRTLQSPPLVDVDDGITYDLSSSGKVVVGAMAAFDFDDLTNFNNEPFGEGQHVPAIKVSTGAVSIDMHGNQDCYLVIVYFDA